MQNKFDMVLSRYVTTDIYTTAITRDDLDMIIISSHL